MVGKKYFAMLGIAGVFYASNAAAQDRPLDPARGNGIDEVVLDDSPSFVSSGFETNSLLSLSNDKVCLKEREVRVASTRSPQFNRTYGPSDLFLDFMDRDSGDRSEEYVPFSGDCADVPASVKDGDGNFVAYLQIGRLERNRLGVYVPVGHTMARVAEGYRAPASEFGLEAAPGQEPPAQPAPAQAVPQPSQTVVVEQPPAQSVPAPQVVVVQPPQTPGSQVTINIEGDREVMQPPTESQRPTSAVVPQSRSGVGTGFPTGAQPVTGEDAAPSVTEEVPSEEAPGRFYANGILLGGLNRLNAEAGAVFRGHELGLAATAGVKHIENNWAAGVSGSIYGRDQSVGAPSTGAPLGDNKFGYRTIGFRGRIGNPNGLNLVLDAEYFRQSVDLRYDALNFSESADGGLFGAGLVVPRLVSNGNGGFAWGVRANGYVEVLNNLRQRNNTARFNVNYGEKTRSVIEVGSNFSDTLEGTRVNFDVGARRDDTYSLVMRNNLPLATFQRLQRQQDSGTVDLRYATLSNTEGYQAVFGAGAHLENGVDLALRVVLPIVGDVRRTAGGIDARYEGFRAGLYCEEVSVPGNGERVSDRSCALTVGAGFGNGPESSFRQRFPVR